MNKLITCEVSELTHKELIANRYDASLYESLEDTLSNIEGIAGFIQDTAIIGIEGKRTNCFISMTNLEMIAKTIVTNAKEAKILLNALAKATNEK